MSTVPTVAETLVAIAKAHRTVDDLCQGRIRWTMNVPAEPDRDPDLIIADALGKAQRLIESLAPWAPPPAADPPPVKVPG